MSGYPSEKGFQNEQLPQHPFSNPAQEGQGLAGAPYMYAPPPPINTGGQTAIAGPGPGTGAPGGNYQGYTGPTGPAPAALGYPGAGQGASTQFLDPTVPRPNDILPLHPAIIQRRQIATTLPPCPQGGYHELRSRHALGINGGTFLSIMCFPIVCCCVRNETECIKCHQKFDIDLPPIQ